MFRITTLILLGIMIATPTWGIVCTPNFCKQKGICANAPTQSGCQAAGKEFRPNTTICKCCATCIAYLDEGDACNIKRPPLQGVPQVIPHCRPGLKCINNVCTKILCGNKNAS